MQLCAVSSETFTNIAEFVGLRKKLYSRVQYWYHVWRACRKISTIQFSITNASGDSDVKLCRNAVQNYERKSNL